MALGKAEPEGVMEEPPLGPVGMVGDPAEAEVVVLALLGAEGRPVEGLTTTVVDPRKVIVEKTESAELETTVPVPTGKELLAREIID